MESECLDALCGEILTGLSSVICIVKKLGVVREVKRWNNLFCRRCDRARCIHHEGGVFLSIHHFSFRQKRKREYHCDAQRGNGFLLCRF